MRRSHGFLAGAVALLVAVAFAYFTGPVRVAPTDRTPSAVSDAGWNAPVWTGGEENARHHWEKHGSQFPQFASEQDFIRGVHAFLLHPPAGTLIKHRDNCDTLYFDPASGTFAVQASNGAPRTFFKPDDGMAYWNGNDGKRDQAQDAAMPGVRRAHVVGARRVRNLRRCGWEDDPSKAPIPTIAAARTKRASARRARHGRHAKRRARREANRVRYCVPGISRELAGIRMQNRRGI